MSKGKNRDHENAQVIRVKYEIDNLLSVVQQYFKSIEEHQKIIIDLKESINLLNAHFIMSSSEIEKHFPEVNNKIYLKPKLTLVKLKKEVDKLTKKKRKKEKKNDTITEKEHNKRIGEAIFYFRDICKNPHSKRRGITQSALAKLVLVTFQQIQKYEKGANGVSSYRLLLIAKGLNISVSDIYIKAYEDHEDSISFFTPYQTIREIDMRDRKPLIKKTLTDSPLADLEKIVYETKKN